MTEGEKEENAGRDRGAVGRAPNAAAALRRHESDRPSIRVLEPALRVRALQR